MKSIFVLVASSLLAGSISFGATFKCSAPKNNSNAFLGNGHAVIQLDKTQLRFQHFDGYSQNPNPLRDYSYAYKGIASGQSKVKGMMKFVLVKQNESYGDAIYTLYVDSALSEGRNGALIFTGHGYSWDWNYCRNLN